MIHFGSWLASHKENIFVTSDYKETNDLFKRANRISGFVPEHRVAHVVVTRQNDSSVLSH